MQISRFKLFWKPIGLFSSLHDIDEISKVVEEALTRKDDELYYEEDNILKIQDEIP